MQFECLKEKIHNAVLLAERITEKNLSLAVLGSILLTVEKNTLKILATNLDIGIEVTLPIKVKKEGIIAIPGDILSSLLSNIHSDTVHIEVDNNKNLNITTKNTKTQIKSYPHDDFPSLPKVGKEQSFIIPVAKFILGLKSVWYSATLSNIKPEISSVFIYTDGDNVIFVATDSFRLAEKKIQLESVVKDISLLIPFKNISEIIHILDGKDGDLLLSFNKNQISFLINDIYITSRLINGIFPDYKQILPKDFTTEVVVLKQDLLNAIKTTNIFSDKFNKITIKTEKSKKQFEVYSANSDIGENKTVINTTLKGDDISLNFNYKYIIDCFQSITKDSISLEFNGNSQPMVMKNIGDTSFTYLIMPLNQ